MFHDTIPYQSVVFFNYSEYYLNHRYLQMRPEVERARDLLEEMLYLLKRRRKVKFQLSLKRFN